MALVRPRSIGRGFPIKLVRDHGSDLWCRQAGSTMNYAQVRHTRPEVKQVLLDMDAWELQQS
jgi:hypothetical protein